MIKAIVVGCMPFEDVISRLLPAGLDLFHIDTEDADGCLPWPFPFDRLQSAITHWEFKNDGKTEQEATLELLSSQR